MKSDLSSWNYPLAENHPESLKTPTGRSFDEVTLESVLSGEVQLEDLRVTAEALEAQATFAKGAGRPQLAANLLRASELVALPEETILAIYNALRPGRASASDLLAWADDLESRHHAKRCAQFLREAAAAYFPGSG